MKRFIITIGIIYLVFYGYCKFFGNCCWVNYTSDIKKIAIPLQSKISEFILANNRGPTPSEKENFLKELNCNDVYIGRYDIYCSFKGKQFMVESSITFDGIDEDNKPQSTGYPIKIRYGNSACSASIYSNGKPKELFCYKTGCIEIHQ